ncbi:MAG: nitroreductase family protein [Bacillota bacterium]
MQYELFANLVRTRRSIRRYKPDPVPDEMLLQAIDLATWAPNGGNFQPWQFWIIKNRDVINQMADAVDARSRLMASWPESEPFREHADRWVRVGAFFRHAPACIAVMVGGYQSIADKLLAARGTADPAAAEMAEWRRFGASRIQTIGGAIMILLLELHRQGLGACWMAGPQQAKGEIEQILGVPREYEFVALIPVGYPAEEREGAPRKPLEQVVKIIG